MLEIEEKFRNKQGTLEFNPEAVAFLYSLNFPLTHHCMIEPHWKDTIYGLRVNKFSVIEKE